MSKIKTIAIHYNNEAFACILRMMLADNPLFRVRLFANEMDLVNYIHIVPIDLLIYDCATLDHEATTSIHYLRNINVAKNNFQTIVLCKDIVEGINSAAKYTDINEVIVKPMSPLYFKDRVEASLGDKTYFGNKMRRNTKAFFSQKNITQEKQGKPISQTKYRDNIIPLFGAKNSLTPENHVE